MPSRRTVVSLTLGALLTAVAAAPVVTMSSASAATAVAVTVNATAGLGKIPPGAIGLNTAIYDGNMNNAAQPGLIKAGGFNALRYPGGSYADIYHWQTHTTQGGYVASNTSFAQFMGTAQAAGASPIIAVNYGTGTAAEAAGWVRDANVTNGYGITYWEVGNETYGNGTYGANWEADSHCRDASGNAIPTSGGPNQTYSCGPAVYAAGVLDYISAMKAADPGIHVCAVLTTPGFWPDNVTNATTSPKPWNETVLTALGAKTDCVIVHYYPAGYPADSDLGKLLNYPSQIAGIVSTVKSQVRQFAGVDPAKVPIMVTETNSGVATNTQPGALFAADMYLTWLENGVANVDWWDQHNGPGTPSVINGAQDYGDYGIFSSGTNGSGVTEPPLDTPFAPYYGIQMVSKLGAPGDTMVNAASGNPMVAVHGVRRADGTLNVLIENKDPVNSYTADLGFTNYTPSGSPTVHTFANNAAAVTSSTQSSASSVTVGPYSLTVLTIPGSGAAVATAPGPPGQPAATKLASTTAGNDTGSATLSWAASAAGSYPVAKYEVYQAGKLIATQTGTTLDLTGLTIGASYSYDVVAVDTQGNTSLRSSPATFVVPPPADASCAVKYEVINSWQGGFIGSITVTNRAATPVAGWKLTFTWPAAGESLQSGWNGTWTQTGQTVTVTGTSSTDAIGANGGTVTVGFQGIETGQKPAPTVFYLNGTVCANV
jgi:cellulose binding protein with CBM2 domain/fibronectin type III domain protein